MPWCAGCLAVVLSARNLSTDLHDPMGIVEMLVDATILIGVASSSLFVCYACMWLIHG
jgi:hypothetical protein